MYATVASPDAGVIGPVVDRGGQVFNVKNVAYAGGAVGNGTTDDTAAIQAAISAAQAVGGIVHFPPGTYLVSKTITPGTLGGFILEGSGPEHSVFRAAAAFTGTWVIDLTFSVSAPDVTARDFSIDMRLNPTLNGIRVGNSLAGAQTDGAKLLNIKTRYGATAIAFDGGCTWLTGRDLRIFNSTQGLHVTNSTGTASPNGSLDNVQINNTDTSVVTAQGVLIDCFLSGLALNNVRVLGTVASVFNGGIVYNSAVAPTGFNGAFIQAVNCITDGITGPGLSLTNCRQFQSTNNFWSALTGTGNYGVVLNAGQYFRFVNDELSACGVQYLNAPDDIGYTSCEFPYTGTTPGVHNMPGASPPTNIQIDLATLNYASRQGAGYQLTNNLAVFYAALTDPASLRFVGVQLSGPGPVVESRSIGDCNTNSTALTLGNVFMMRIWLPKGLPINTLFWCVGSTPFTAGTTTHYWMAIYSEAAGIASGNPLAQSNDNIAPTLNASTLQAVTLASQVVIPATGYYFIALYIQSTGGSPAAPTVSNFGGLSALTNFTPKICYVQQTAYTNGTAPNAAGSAGSIGNEFWCGVG